MSTITTTASQLGGAEYDAERLFRELTQAGVGAYDPSLSKLLFSPTLESLRGAVQDVLFSMPKLQEFTFFFAGHGVILPAGFYMATRDTRLERTSGTAFSLSELFLSVSEASPVQTNIILDACFSGGLTVDLSILTRAETSGYVGSPAVHLLALAARDETAGEFSSGGVGTNALLACICGQALVREDVPSLDLLDIGRVVTERVRRAGSQTPVLSALNVHRRSAFCRNPLYQASAESVLRKWDARNLLDTIEPVLASHSSEPLDLIDDVERLFSHIILSATSSRDAFKAAEVRATSCVALLPYTQHSVISSRILQETALIVAEIEGAAQIAIKALEDEPFAMLAGPGGIANLFLLPIRLSKLLGWVGAAVHLSEYLGKSTDLIRQRLNRLVELISQTYSLSYVAMSDAQAPYLALALTAAERLGLNDSFELVLSSTFSSYVECAGQIAHSGIEPERILSFLMSRLSSNYEGSASDLAQPSELGTVLLLCARLYDMEEIFDHALADLDHVTLNAFLTDDYSLFGQRSIDSGENNVYGIGHTVWTVSDLLSNWPEHAFSLPPADAVASAALLASLVFPDRVPWFIFPGGKMRLPAEG